MNKWPCKNAINISSVREREKENLYKKYNRIKAFVVAFETRWVVVSLLCQERKHKLSSVAET